MGDKIEPLVCPVCGGGEFHYLRCQYAGCTDGRYLVPLSRYFTSEPKYVRTK